MRKGLSSILLIFLLFIINPCAYAEEDNSINYLYTEAELDKDYLTELYYLAADIENLNITYNINYQIVDGDNKADLIYKLVIEESLAKALEIKVNGYLLYDLEFDGLTANLYSYGEYDLGILNINSGILSYKDYDTDITIDNPSFIPELFVENNMDRIVNKIKYIDGYQKDLLYYLEGAPDISLFMQISSVNHDHIEDYKIIVNNYDNTAIGIYYIELFAIRDDGIIYKDIYNIEIKNDNEYFYCDDIYISYKNPISKAKIFEYYIDYYDKDNVLSYSIESEYFNNAAIIGKFKYTVMLEFSGENEVFYNKDCYINVIDDIKPKLEASIVDSVGDGSFIPIEELITASAIDDIDGDISANIKIIDNDNYLTNYNKTGTYTFRVSITDNAGNTESKLVSYDVYVEEVQIDDEIEISDDISIVYEFNVSTTNQLSRALFSQKLVFSGFYESGEELTISSKYFENKEIPGSYLVSVLSNNEVKYFLINVEEGTSNDVVAEEEDKNSYTIYIIIGSIVIALIGGGTAFYFIRKRKRNQE